MERPVFIYWCETEKGEKYAFTSQAMLEVGLRVKDDNDVPAIIVDVDMELPNVSAQELHMDYELMRAMSM